MARDDYILIKSYLRISSVQEGNTQSFNMREVLDPTSFQLYQFICIGRETLIHLNESFWCDFNKPLQRSTFCSAGHVVSEEKVHCSYKR